MCPIGTFAHTIRFGETLWQISQRYRVSVNAIMAVNPGLNPYNLRIGQIICIPLVNR
jgi:peptidoglycan endopeptidase LytF